LNSDVRNRRTVEVSTDKVNKFVKTEVFGDGDGAEIFVLDDFQSTRAINYHKMQGRPSVEITLQGKTTECLLDTGARINAMSKNIFDMLEGTELRESSEILRCANNSLLQIMGRTTLAVRIGQVTKMVEFTVVKEISPGVIGGIELQEQFGFRLMRIADDRRDSNMCNIEGKFGRTTNDEERLNRALSVLNLKEEDGIAEVIKQNKGAFMADNWDIGCTPLVKHNIRTTGGPINTKPWRQPIHLENKIEETVRNLYDNGIIRQCNSPWNTPMVCVWKKGKQEIRLCLDFRKLNAITERQAFPMPNVEDLLDKLNGAGYFSAIDLGNAYYQVLLTEESQEKTAFSTKTGQYCFTRMPFGIAAAPGTFQELMTKVLGNLKGTSVYLDDILVFTKDKTEHIETLGIVFRKIKEAGLRINPEKCQLLKREVKYLGHIIDKNGVRTDPSKIEAIKTFTRPKCVKNLRSFLGICNYYRRFIEGYAQKARTLEELCGMNSPKLLWTEGCERAFSEMKEALTRTPVLGFPDVNKKFILDTDASFESIGAVLSQKDDNGNEKVIAYGSHAMNKHEKGYCVTRKELLAIFYFCNHFKHYLYGKQFLLRTDHKAITFMLHTRKPITPQFQNWINFLSSLDMIMEFRQGAKHTNADMLSRMKCDTCTQCLMAHEDAKVDKKRTRTLDAIGEMENYIWQTNSEEILRIREDIRLGKSWRFRLERGVVMTSTGKIWIPEDKRQEMIKATHRMLSHAGVEKTYGYIAAAYDMLQMKEMIKYTIRECEACQKNKVVTTATKEETIQLSANEPFEKLYMDICGPFRESFRKKKYVVAIIDRYSRYISLVAVAKQDEETIKKTLMDDWILKYGAPRELHVDCGKVFTSDAMKKLTDKLGITLCFSSPYHHNTNGMVERQFRTVRDLINASCRDRGRLDWAELLPEIAFTMNATVQKTLNMSPAEIVFGRKLYRERWVSRSGGCKKKEFQNTDYLTRREFQEGDVVLIKVETRTKDNDRFEGPFTVVERIHERRYLLRNVQGKTVERNVEKIKRFFKEGGCKEDK